MEWFLILSFFQQNVLEPQDKDQVQGSVRKAWTQGRDAAKGMTVEYFVKSSETDKRSSEVVVQTHFLKASKNFKVIVPQQPSQGPKIEKGISRRYL